MTLDLLKQLRDIHYPQPIPLWPPAPGWYVVFAALILGMIFLSFYIYRYWVKHRLKRLVLQRLQELELQENVHVNVSAELSVLLKRAALAKYPRTQVAGLFGEDWLRFLDKTAQTREFTLGTGRLLVVYPYQEQHATIPRDLFHLIREWVKKNL